MHIHHHAVAFLAHAALENVRHAKLPPDVAHVLSCGVTKRHHRGTTDDSELFNLCQTRQDIVLNAVCEKCVLFLRTEILERQYRDTFFLRQRGCWRLPGIKPDAQTRGSDEKDGGGCDRDIYASKSRWSAGSGSFGSLFGLRVLNHFRRLRISKVVAIKIYQENGDCVLYCAFPQVMQMCSPASRLGQILRHSLG